MELEGARMMLDLRGWRSPKQSKELKDQAKLQARKPGDDDPRRRQDE